MNYEYPVHYTVGEAVGFTVAAVFCTLFWVWHFWVRHLIVELQVARKELELTKSQSDFWEKRYKEANDVARFWFKKCGGE